jgi:uncharacterized metal-binding protein
MPNADAHDAITYSLIPFTYLAAEMYWGGDHTVSVIATGAMIFSGLMFGPDLDLNSRPYRRWGPLRFIWKPYQSLLPHRSLLSHGPVLGTLIRIIYFLLMFCLVGATVLYLIRVYFRGQETTWGAEYAMIKADLFDIWDQTEKHYFWGAFCGMWLGALAHTTADMFWSTYKKIF